MASLMAFLIASSSALAAISLGMPHAAPTYCNNHEQLLLTRDFSSKFRYNCYTNNKEKFVCIYIGKEKIGCGRHRYTLKTIYFHVHKKDVTCSVQGYIFESAFCVENYSPMLANTNYIDNGIVKVLVKPLENDNHLKITVDVDANPKPHFFKWQGFENSKASFRQAEPKELPGHQSSWRYELIARDWVESDLNTLYLLEVENQLGTKYYPVRATKLDVERSESSKMINKIALVVGAITIVVIICGTLGLLLRYIHLKRRNALPADPENPRNPLQATDSEMNTVNYRASESDRTPPKIAINQSVMSNDDSTESDFNSVDSDSAVDVEKSDTRQRSNECGEEHPLSPEIEEESGDETTKSTSIKKGASSWRPK